MTPDNFDLASLSRRHLDVLELDRLVVGADQSPLRNGVTEIVHSSIIVVDPMVPSRILHHQVSLTIAPLFECELGMCFGVSSVVNSSWRTHI